MNAGRAEQVDGHGADGSGRGGITILVSHRFSTVRMADLIVVLGGARLVEVGTHEELVARVANIPSSTGFRRRRTADHGCAGSRPLPFDLVAEILDGVADFSPAFTKFVLHVAFKLIGCALVA